MYGVSWIYLFNPSKRAANNEYICTPYCALQPGKRSSILGSSIKRTKAIQRVPLLGIFT